jgi:tetratricopeptide (TPR) repeat protein
MHDDDRDVDLSIQLVPIRGAAKHRKPQRRLVPYVLIACAIFVSLAAVLAFVAKVAAILNSRRADVTVTAQTDPADDRAEAVAVFGRFDALEDRASQLTPSERLEREAIAALFDQLETCAAAKDDAEFRTLVDFDRMLKRIELTGSINGWTTLEKKYLRTELKTSANVEPYWGKIVVAGLVTPADDPNSRIVYAFGWDEPTNNQTENRFWIGRTGDSWQLYDWELLELGLSESQEWGLYCRYHETPEMKGFHRWAELMVEADSLTADGDMEAAKEKLRLAESQLVPREFDDYHWVLTGYRWTGLAEDSEAERCYSHVKQPDYTPGVYYNLMSCRRWGRPAEALKYAQLYEAATGCSPALSEVKAQLFERLNRKKEAVEEWKKLLCMQPDNSQALTELYLALPKDDKSAFEAQVARLEDPTAAVVRVATSVGYRDYSGLSFLVRYMAREAPGSPATLYVTGFAESLDGRYREAAELYRRAYESETDKDTRDSYVNAYLEAMVASGEVIAALKTLPDQKSPFEMLLGSYDEGELSLTEEEYHELVALYAARFPDDLAGVRRRADLAIEEQRFEEAERLLRHALELTPADDQEDADGDDEQSNENKYYRESFASSLANVLCELGRLKEAYENGGERKQRFSQLARQAIQDNRWDDVRLLLDLHRVNERDDVEIHRIEGELAAHEKRWDDAIRHFRQGLIVTPEGESWSLKSRLLDVCIESRRWMEYYTTLDDPRAAFDDLASRFVADDDWDALNRLIVAHRSRSRDDVNIVKYEAEVAWDRKEYSAYARCAEELLKCNDERIIPWYERETVTNRRLSALLRGKRFDQALELAKSEQRADNDVAMLAIVNAATGNLAEAKRFARQAATANESALAFYTHDDVAHIFLGNQFSDLHREFPVGLPYQAAPTLAVFLSDRPWQLEASDISAALEQLGIDTTATAERLDAGDKNVTRAFALRFDKTSVWLATGEGKFDDGWKLDDRQAPLAGTVNNSRAWLAVGTAAWTEPDRKQAETLARRLSCQLADGHATALCALRRDAPDAFTAYPAKPDLIQAWRSSGNLKPFKDQGVSLESTDRTGDVAANRQFDRSLREAVREFESSAIAEFEVWGCLTDRPWVDLLRLDVTAVRRTYGSLEFDGNLKHDSRLVPQPRAGLPMRFGEYEVRAWRLNAEAPVYRP